MTVTSLNQEIFAEMKRVVPGGVNSPVRSFKGVDQDPMVAERGVGDTIIDCDGNVFIDFCMSWGALMHGHAHPQIIDAACKRMQKGTSFGVTTGIEGKLAKKIFELLDAVDKVRFVSSGTEAAMSAVRLARGFTKRHLVVKFSGNYHGHADFFLVKAGSGVNCLSESSSAGIPPEVVQQIVSLEYNDVDGVRSFLQNNRVACVILEPVAGNMGVVPASREFIHMLREETARQGALLIFDEVMTGFRVGLQGACGLFNVKPDLLCLGKVIGGGFPAAAFGGRREIMDYLAPDGPVYQAGTLSGNPLAMEGGFQALQMLDTPGFYKEMDRKTDLLIHSVEDYIRAHALPVCIQRVGSMFTIFFGRRSVYNYAEALTLDTVQFARFFRYMYSNGVYIPPSQFEAWFVSGAHTDEHLKKAAELAIGYLQENF